MPLGSLYELMFAHAAAQESAARAQQEQLRQENRQQTNTDRDFYVKQAQASKQHDLDLAASKAKMAGALGQQAPQFNDDESQAEAEPAYMSGQLEKYKTDIPTNIAMLNDDSKTQIATANNDTKTAQNEANRQLQINKFLEDQGRREHDASTTDQYHHEQLAEQQRYHDLMAYLMRDRHDQAQERNDEKMKVQLGAKLAPLESEHADLDQLESAATQDGGAAGIGPWAQYIPDLGYDIAARLGFDVGKDAIANRRAAGNLRSLISFARGGKTLTPSEERSALRSYGIYEGAPETVLSEGIRRMKRDAAIGEAQFKNSYPKRVAQDYDATSTTPALTPEDEGPSPDDLEKSYRGASN